MHRERSSHCGEDSNCVDLICADFCVPNDCCRLELSLSCTSLKYIALESQVSYIYDKARFGIISKF